MLKSTLIAYGIALVFFGVYGFMHAGSGAVDTSEATVLMEGIRDTFNINPLLLLPPVIAPEHPAYEELYSQLKEIAKYRIYKKDFKLGRFSALMNICTILMPYCQRISNESPIPDPGNQAVMICMRYIHNHYYRRKITLRVLADKCHLHPNYLCSVFKSYTGQTVFEYLNRYRIEIARDLLRQEDLSVSRIAELTGFHSESLFYQKFKEFTGTTPLAYRKQQTHTED
jgi:YesN/AraC family two-component response regulator